MSDENDVGTILIKEPGRIYVWHFFVIEYEEDVKYGYGETIFFSPISFSRPRW